MKSIKDQYEEIKVAISEIEPDIQKFIHKGMSQSALRSRNGLRDIRNKIEKLRNDIQEQRKSEKND